MHWWLAWHSTCITWVCISQPLYTNKRKCTAWTWRDDWINQGKYRGMTFLTSSQQVHCMDSLFCEPGDVCSPCLKHQPITSMNGIMNGWIDEWLVDICGQYVLIPKTSPMTFWTQNTILSTSWVAIRSIRAFFRCLHSNTWTPEACITYFTITQAFFIWKSPINTEMVCWMSFRWAESSFWTKLTFDTPSDCIWASWALYKLCFVWTTEITMQEITTLCRYNVIISKWTNVSWIEHFVDEWLYNQDASGTEV